MERWETIDLPSAGAAWGVGDGWVRAIADPLHVRRIHYFGPSIRTALAAESVDAQTRNIRGENLMLDNDNGKTVTIQAQPARC